MNHAKNVSSRRDTGEKAEIHPGQDRDIEACVGLISTLFTLETEFHFNPEPIRKALSMILASSNACLMVAELEGQVVGMATGQLVISTACGAPSLWMEDVVVSQDFRGRGIGKRIVKSVEAWALSKNGSRCQLLADSQNQPALDFYARLGYAPSRMVPYRKML